MKFVYFHGSFGSPNENWVGYVKDELYKLGYELLRPQFPVEDWQKITQAGPKRAVKNQSLSNWLAVFDEFYQSYLSNPKEKKCFISHSLGPVFVLHVLQQYRIQLDSAIFVSPFLNSLGGKWQFDHVNASFYNTDFDFDLIQRLVPISYTLYGSNDPYVEPERAQTFSQKIQSSFIEVHNGGHLNTSAGFDTFPLLLELCKTRL